MNLMVKYIFLVLQVYAISSSLVLQESSASSHFESASGPEGSKRLEPSSSPNTPLNEPPPDAAAPIPSIPDGSPPSPSVIPPTSPVSVPPIPQPEQGPATKSPVSPPTASAQITSPPNNGLQSPPPMAQAAPPSMSQAPPPFILPEPVTPPTKTPVASPPTSPALPVPPHNLPLPAELPPSTLPSSPPMPPSTLPSSPPTPPSTLPSSPPTPPSTLPSSPPSILPSSPPMPPSTLPSSPPMPPSTLPGSPPTPPSTLPGSPPTPPSTLPSSPPSILPSSPPMPPSTLPSSPPSILPSSPPMPPSTLPDSPPTPPSTPIPPSTLPSSPPVPPSTLPSSPPMPPSTLPSSPPVPPSTLPSSPPVPPSTLPSSPPMPPSALPSSPPMPPRTLPSSPPIMPVPPSTLPAPVALPPTTIPRNPPPSQPTLTFPPPDLPDPVASSPSTLPKASPPSPSASTIPPPNLPVPVALPPHASQVNVPPPHPLFTPPPSNLSVPVALPPSSSPRNLQPIHPNSSMPPPNLPEPRISPVSTPILPSPSNRTTNDIAPSPPPVKAPIGHKAPSSDNHAPPPHSSSESPPDKSHPPPVYPPPPPPGPKLNPTHHNPPPSAGPESNNPRHHAPTPTSLGSTVPPVENSISPSSSSPPTTSPSVQTTMPVLSPKVSPHNPPRIPKPLQALPPPPPNEDCSSITCMEPLTNTPPGTPCKCVLPMQVELRLGTSLYNFFPLVSELAFEMASGLFMRSSQVRIMGANEDDQDPEKTIVIISLVPLGEKFDNYTAYVTAQRLWLKQVPIKSSIFGDYDVLFVKYPGLPPSPPMPSSGNDGNGGPYGHGNNGRDIKPLGVDVSKQRRDNKLSGGVIAIIALSAVVAVVLASVAVWVLVVKLRDRAAQSGPKTSTALPSVTKSSGVGGSMTGSGVESASLSFRSTIAYNGSAKTFSSSDIEKATDNFNESGVVGEGGFGRVYSGVLEDGTKVAVKVLKRDDQQGGREFLAEVEMLSRLHHRNLVRLIGICTEERNRCLVYELIPNGSLESHLHGIDKETAPLDWGARLKIALGAARGLAYLHEDSSPRVIHRDFKSSNILLEHDFNPKVSDFGLARSALDEENQHISTRVMGTFGYVAPEYAMTGHLLVKSDVYSYGVVLLELLTGRKPVDMSMPSGQENLVAWARPLLPTPEGLNLLIDPSLSPEVPFDSIAKVAAIASMCVQPEVSHRPFMGEVVQALKLVCNECEETRDLGSRSCSQEDLTSMDFDHRPSTNSGLGPDPDPSQTTYQSYESPLDVESGFSGLGLDADSYRITSSSGPLRPRRRLQIWERVKRFSSGSMNDYGDLLRFLQRSR